MGKNSSRMMGGLAFLVACLWSGMALAASPLLHNATNLGSTKSGGNWGLPGGTYGEFTCATCHNKTTTNVKRIVESIPSTIGPNVPKTVTFKNMTAFGNDSVSHSTSVRICESCHTQTKYHQYNSANAPQSGDTSHPNGDCTGCHPHSLGFKATGCTACHGHNAASSNPIATNKHTAHMNNATLLGANYSCADCHAPTVSSDTVFSNPANHQNGTVNYGGTRAGTYDSGTQTCTSYCHTDGKGGAAAVPVLWNATVNNLDCKGCHGAGSIAGEPAYTTGNSHAKHVTGAADCVSCHFPTTANGTSIKGSHTNQSIDVESSTGIGYLAAGKTCSTATCHANVYGTGSVTTPAWGTAAGCSACHSVAIGSTGPATGSHVKHNDTNCADCHAAGTTPTTKPLTGHLDGTITVTDGYPATAKHAAGTYTGTCSTATCHANVYGTGTVTTPVWGVAAANCTACHSVSIATTGPATGSHAKHNVTDCSQCHAGATNNSTIPTANHADGNIDVTGGYPANVTKHAQGTYTGTCSTATCHANVYGTGSVTTPIWGVAAANCTACHSVAIASTGPATGSHAKHNDANCADCHTGASNNSTIPTANHINNTIDVTGGYPVTAKHAAGTYTGTCSTATCHANVYGTGSVTTPIWGVAATGCTACHSVAIATTGPATGSHAKHNVTDCSQCHAGATTSGTIPTANHIDGNIDVTGGYPANVAKHAQGTYTGTCSTATCHANVYGTGSVTTPIWGVAAANCTACHSVSIATTGPATGSHAKHNDTNCADCHTGATNNSTIPTANHINNTIDVTGGYPVTAKHAQGTYTGTCSTATCHANVYGTGSVATPVWGVAAANCTACHSVAIATTGPATGSHAKHNDTNCVDCHAAGTSATTMPSTGHLDGTITVTGGYPATAKHAAGTYTGTCSTASCHDNGTGTAVTTPVWGTTAPACTACHAAAPATGSHSRHLATTMRMGVVSISCADCHTGAVAGSNGGTGHLDGNVDVAAGTSYPQNIAKHAAGTYTGTCSTVYCHSNGSTAARATTYKAISWGVATLDCEGCHPTSGLTAGHSIHISTMLTERKATLSYNNYSANASGGTVYKFGCANCHPVDITKHINGTVDIDMTTTAGSGTLKGKNPGTAAYDMASTKKCSNVYCHSNGYATNLVYAQSPAWTGTFTGDRCAGCHGNSPSTTIVGSAAHAAHVVGIHTTNIFSGTSGKLPQSAAKGGAINAAHGTDSRSTTLNCNICHNDTIQTSANDNNTACVSCHTTGNLKNPTSLISNTAFHVNGQVNVKFANTQIVSKAQLRSGSFDSYTAAAAGGWSRNKSLYKNYTSAYDVSKTTLFSTAGFSAGNCSNVACHAGKSVSWTSTTVTCDSCHTRL